MLSFHSNSTAIEFPYEKERWTDLEVLHNIAFKAWELSFLFPFLLELSSFHYLFPWIQLIQLEDLINQKKKD